MSLKIEETFQVKAPVDRVWSYLVDPRRVVTCLPGAELTGVENETTFLGKVKIKVGPVTVAYNGKVTITEQDDAAHRIRMVGEGRESAGTGSAKMTMTSEVVAAAGGASEVKVVADVAVVGKIMQFGRGMVESVNKQLFRQFTECVRATLESAEPGAGEPSAAESPVAAPSGAAPASPAPAAPAPSPSAAAPPAPAPATAAPAAPAAPAPPPAPARSAVPAPSAAPVAAKPVRIIPLLLRALWEWISKLWRPRAAGG